MKSNIVLGLLVVLTCFGLMTIDRWYPKKIPQPQVIPRESVIPKSQVIPQPEEPKGPKSEFELDEEYYERFGKPRPRPGSTSLNRYLPEVSP